MSNVLTGETRKLQQNQNNANSLISTNNPPSTILLPEEYFNSSINILISSPDSVGDGKHVSDVSKIQSPTTATHRRRHQRVGSVGLLSPANQSRMEHVHLRRSADRLSRAAMNPNSEMESVKYGGDQNDDGESVWRSNWRFAADGADGRAEINDEKNKEPLQSAYVLQRVMTNTGDLIDMVKTKLDKARELLLARRPHCSHPTSAGTSADCLVKSYKLNLSQLLQHQRAPREWTGYNKNNEAPWQQSMATAFPQYYDCSDRRQPVGLTSSRCNRVRSAMKKSSSPVVTNKNYMFGDSSTNQDNDLDNSDDANFSVVTLSEPGQYDTNSWPMEDNNKQLKSEEHYIIGNTVDNEVDDTVVKRSYSSGTDIPGLLEICLAANKDKMRCYDDYMRNVARVAANSGNKFVGR